MHGTVSHSSSSRPTMGNESQRMPDRPPSLLAGLTAADFPNDDTDALIPPRPRRLWTVSDTGLRPPPLPFLQTATTRYVSDAPPSVVAVRISECLRQRSIAVEYDDEAVTASCLTSDRCEFVVHLWQGLLVEVLRVKGSTLTFHRTAMAILNAASSLDAGKDARQPYQCAPTEFRRMQQVTESSLLVDEPKGDVTPRAVEGLEHALTLLRKDRLEAQVLGMEYLVSLTDSYSSGMDVALFTALVVLGAPLTKGIESHGAFLTEIHENWILLPLCQRRLPFEPVPPEHTTNNASFALSCGSRATEDESPPEASIVGLGNESHGGEIRSLALRALSNALTLIATQKPRILQNVLSVQAPQLIGLPLLDALLEDVQGATRPPAVVAGTRLASPHESALAVHCLHILGEHSDAVAEYVLTEERMEALLKARNVGKSTHRVLEQCAEEAYMELSEDERSC